MIDADVTETMAAHAEELADFDAKLYAKPWGDGSPIEYAYELSRRHYVKTGALPARLRCSNLAVREMLREQTGSTHLPVAEITGLAVFHVCGVAGYVDRSLTGYRVEIAD